MDATLKLSDLLPMAIGIALSPMPIAAVILMLFTPKARTNGVAFVLGWLGGLILVGGAIMLFGGDSAGTTDDPSVASLWVKTALGVLLLLLAVRQWSTRPGPDEEPVVPKWMQAVDTFTAAKAFGVAALLSGVNPKNLAFDAAGVAVILQAELDPTAQWIAFGIFILLASVTVIVPVAYYLIAGDRADATLRSMKKWLIANNAAVMSVLLLIFGVKLLTEGVQGLLG